MSLFDWLFGKQPNPRPTYCAECGEKLTHRIETAKADPYTGKALVKRHTLYCGECQSDEVIEWNEKAGAL